MGNKTSAFDPEEVDPKFYSNDPYQHGSSDYGRVTEGTNLETFNSVSGMDQDIENTELVAGLRERNLGEGHPETPKGESLDTDQEWEVDPEAVDQGSHAHPKMISDEANSKLEDIADNPSDEALFHRHDATYLEQNDNPNDDYDPHKMGYGDEPDKRKS